MITRMSSAITQLMRLRSGVLFHPVFASAAVSAFWSQPSTFSEPMVVETLPAGPSTDLNDSPCLVRKSLVRSQSENLLQGPTKMWNLQSAEFAATWIGVFFEYSSRPGLM